MLFSACAGTNPGKASAERSTNYEREVEAIYESEENYRGSREEENRDTRLHDRCKDGYGDACYDMGKKYFHGTDGEKSFKKAGKYFFRGCKLDHGRSCFVLGMMFNNAVGTRRNCKKADEFFMRGCELDNENSCVYLWECEESKEKGRFYFRNEESSRNEYEDNYDEFDQYDESDNYDDW